MKKRFGFSWGSTSTGGTTATTATPAERRGEVNELKTLLRDPYVQKDNLRMRDIIKRVLGFMTLGMDTSAVFTELIMACITKDLVQKKMIYFYLCVHSESNNEQAILAINTLQKDCRDESPLVRGLALRSLASFRLPSIAEYLVPVLKQSLTDSAPYVRKTAVLASLKLYRFAPETFRQMGLSDKMYGMLRDNDAQVCINALAVLNEIFHDEGGPTINKGILYFLLNRLRDMTEWQQTAILQLTSKYTPANEEEMFDIMNLLEERLRGNNSGVIIACAHVFLVLTQNLPKVHSQVFERLKEPLLTLYGTAHTYEQSYTILCHIKLLVQREPKVFGAHYKEFYLRPNDPSFVKCVKIDIMTLIANDANAKDIVGELVEYVGDMNGAISKLSIAGIGSVALRVESCAKHALDHFLDLLAMSVEHVRGQTLVAMKDFLRKYNDIDTVRPFLSAIVSSYKDLAFQDDDSKVALAWVLGEFGEHIEDAPYILESMCGQFLSESPAMRLELLTALMKLLFKRPPEVQPVLGPVFTMAISDFSHADVHDRALLYYRLLRTNARAASQIVCAPKSAVAQFVEDDTSDVRDKLFEEFNTMSIIFGCAASQYNRAAQADESDEEDEEEEEEEPEEENAGEANLLSRALDLDPDADIEPPTFKELWGKLPTVVVNNMRLKQAPNTDTLSDALEDVNIFTMATGSIGAAQRMFIFAIPQGGDEKAAMLVELLIKPTGEVQATTKCADNGDGKAFLDIFNGVLQKFN